MLNIYMYMSPDAGKSVFGVSNQVPHKPVCAATENDKKLEILDLERIANVLSV